MQIKRFEEVKGPILFEPKVFSDNRGHFFESYSQKKFEELTNLSLDFVQDNHVFSVKGVVRGMHWQIKNPMDKLVRCVKGEIYDVAVDIRKDSPTFKKYVGVTLSEKNNKMFLAPKGFAHGYMALTDETVVLYKCSNIYCPEGERAFRFDDREIAVNWPEGIKVIQNGKDEKAPFFKDLKSVDLF
jgi:dTDP-4-dehydrorhamnose 3,5-epimerase